MLSQEKIDGFVKNGYTFMRGAINQSFIDEWWGPREKFVQATQSNHPESHLYLPSIREVDLSARLPHVKHAIEQLVGKQNILDGSTLLRDGFIVAQPQDKEKADQKTYPWHKDGFFRHYLDSPEKGLVILVFWTDVTIENGSTALATESVPLIAQELLDNPQGLAPDHFDKKEILPEVWTEKRATGLAGDICFMHPLLIHAVRPNLTTNFRAITNPSVSLKEPMNFNRQDGQRYSPVERAILHALKAKNLPSYFPSGERITVSTTKEAQGLNHMREQLKAKVIGFGLGLK